MSYAVVEFESYGTIEVVCADWIIRNGAGVVHVLWPNSCSSVNITALVKKHAKPDHSTWKPYSACILKSYGE